MITNIQEVQVDRLTWPHNKPRSAHRVHNWRFETAEVNTESQKIGRELTLMAARFYVISRNNQRIFAGDPGVAVWWVDAKNELRVLASDKFDTQAHNLHAIVLTLAAMRGLERWGAYTIEQAVEGARIALPAPETETLDWKLVFKAPPVAAGLAKNDILDIVNARYRRMCAEANGDQNEIRRLNLAVEAARLELRA